MTAEREALEAERSKNALQRDGAGEIAAMDDLDEIEPVYQGLRTYAQNRRLLVLSIADLRRAARVAIQALANPATIRDTDEDAELVDALIRAARDVEWEAHFGAKWDARRATMLRARERILNSCRASRSIATLSCVRTPQRNLRLPRCARLRPRMEDALMEQPELVEKVARAIEARRFGEEYAQVEVTPLGRELARAAITALTTTADDALRDDAEWLRNLAKWQPQSIGERLSEIASRLSTDHGGGVSDYCGIVQVDESFTEPDDPKP